MNESQLTCFAQAVNHVRARCLEPGHYTSSLVELYSQFASDEDLLSLATKAAERAASISIDATEDHSLEELSSLSASRLVALNKCCYEQLLAEVAIVAAAKLEYTEDFLPTQV